MVSSDIETAISPSRNDDCNRYHPYKKDIENDICNYRISRFFLFPLFARHFFPLPLPFISPPLFFCKPSVCQHAHTFLFYLSPYKNVKFFLQSLFPQKCPSLITTFFNTLFPRKKQLITCLLYIFFFHIGIT